MKYFSFFLFTSFFAFQIISCGPAKKSQPEPIKLFQENAGDWIKQGNADWQFNQSELVGKLDTGAGFVITETVYDNFVLQMEFNPDSTINSGVFVRCAGYEMTPIICHEINIWDLHPNQDFRTGAIVTKVKPFEKVETLNKWNTYKIKCEQGQTQVWVNDVLTAEISDDSLLKGHIGLQAAGAGEIRFRNIVLNELK
ncbi:MAG: DUF1080 domain-containing protein [Bacteroidota bacterium]